MAERNKNKTLNGFLPALVLPLVIFVILYVVKQQGVGFKDYLISMWKLGALLKILSICVLPNLLLFLYFYRNKYDIAARGVIMATFLYAILMMISKVL